MDALLVPAFPPLIDGFLVGFAGLLGFFFGFDGLDGGGIVDDDRGIREALPQPPAARLLGLALARRFFANQKRFFADTIQRLLRAHLTP